MNWKSYTLVSGVGVLATWFAASQPQVPDSVTPAQPREAVSVSAAASDIEQQANRLQARLQSHALYREPSRNLFRFSERRSPAPAATRDEEAASFAPPAPLPPPPPPLKLTAIAVDGDARTAVLSTPAGVVLAKEGDEVLGRFRVVLISDDAIELAAVADGAVLKLSLR